jgi:hypothetical protein
MCVVPEAEAKEALSYVNECMRWRPSWAETLPLACELGMGVNYDECGKKKAIEEWGVLNEGRLLTNVFTRTKRN